MRGKRGCRVDKKKKKKKKKKQTSVTLNLCLYIYIYRKQKEMKNVVIKREGERIWTENAIRWVSTT